MKIILSLDTCRGNGACVVAAPDLFDYSDETGQAVALVVTVAPQLQASARMAAMHCPTRSITLEPGVDS